MFKTLINVFRIPELRNKILFTLAMLAIYRIGYHIPIPGVDQSAMEQLSAQQSGDGSAAGRLASYVSLFSGGNLSSSTIFGLGIMPYISASIIFQLLATVVPALEKLQKEGETGRKKIQEWTRYTTVPLCVIQAVIWINYMHSVNLVQANFAHSVTFWIMGVFSHRGLYFSDVAGRADRRIRPGQRCQPDHPGRHCRPYAQCVCDPRAAVQPRQS
jgi:preprotein translocase subunit SecY